MTIVLEQIWITVYLSAKGHTVVLIIEAVYAENQEVNN
jgi:hypothetical protein